MDKNAAISWVEARLAERSTWLGLIAMLSTFGVAIKPDMANMIVLAGVALGGAIHVFTSDHNVGKAVSAAVDAAMTERQTQQAAAAPAPAADAPAEDAK